MKKPCGSPQLRKLINRDGLACFYCGWTCDLNAPLDSDRFPTRDHVIARSNGGKSVMTNLVLACKKCNNAKGRRSAMEFIQIRT